MYPERGLFVDGGWRRSRGAGENAVLDPATGESLGSPPMASADDTRDAIEAASRAFLQRSVTPAWTRADILRKVAAITPFGSDDEVYARDNDSIDGLSACAFTRSASRGCEAEARIQSGMVGIHSFALAAAGAPFGGTKYSGRGREGGTEGIADYSNVKLGQVALP